MIRNNHKALTSGAVAFVQDAPPRSLILDDEAPPILAEFLRDLDDANEAARAAHAAHREAARAAREANEVERPSAVDAANEADHEARARTVAARRAAQALATALDEAAPVLRGLSGRVALEADDRARQALRDLRSALETRESASPLGNLAPRDEDGVPRWAHWQTDRVVRGRIGGGGLRALFDTMERVVDGFPRDEIREEVGK